MADKKKLAAFVSVSLGLVLLIVTGALKREWLLDKWYFYQLSQKTNGPHIAGVVFGDDGRRVAGASIRCCGQRLIGPRVGYQYGGDEQTRLRTVTDAQGRFALAEVKKGFYNLRFSADGQATFIHYEVPEGTMDRFAFTRGASLAGRITQASTGKPLRAVKVQVEQASRWSYSHLGFESDREVVTDAAGQFRFDNLRTVIRDSYKETYSPREWKVSCLDTTCTIFFEEGMVNVKDRSGAQVEMEFSADSGQPAQFRNQ